MIFDVCGMGGLGLCPWRLNRFVEAELPFDRMLRLNPRDDQGIRFSIDQVRAEEPWTDDQPEAALQLAGGVLNCGAGKSRRHPPLGDSNE